MLNEESIRRILGVKVKHLRLEKSVSLTELANKTGISVSYLTEIEKGKKHPKPSKIAVIADALGVSYDQMVSLQLDKKLQPVAQLLGSNLLYDLPLEHFGLDAARLIDIFATAPTKMSAFVNTIVEMARSHNLSLEQFYFSALRTYQEMHENYFPQLEDEADKFAESQNLESKQISSARLKELLKNLYGVETSETLNQLEGMDSLRSFYLQSQKHLYINPLLSEQQKAFVLARELGFQRLNLSPRPYTSAWVTVNSFDEVFHNFQASYFAGALLLNRDQLVIDLDRFLSQNTWDEVSLLKLLANYHTTPETLLHRISSLLPKFFGVQQLFFLRFELRNDGEYFLSKELHLSGLQRPHATYSNEHYCRRWVALQVLQDPKTDEWTAGIQVSSYLDSDDKYLVFSIGQKKTSITLGLLLNPQIKEKIRFVNDPAIPQRVVHTTCERCRLTDCMERAAKPRIFEELLKQENLKAALKKLSS